MTASPIVRAKSRTAVARQEIRGRILRLEMAPGLAFNEGDLAHSLAQGKTPVREALNLLTHEGLVAVAPHAGYLVMPVTLRDVRELLELRLSVQTLTARLVARRRDDPALRRLGEYARLLREGRVEPAADAVAGLDARLVGPVLFGAALAEQAGNARAAEADGYVLHHQVRHLYLAAALGEPRWPAPDHRALLAALTAGDPDAAEAAVEAEVRALGRAVFAALAPAVGAPVDGVSAAGASAAGASAAGVSEDGAPFDGLGAGLPEHVLDVELGALLVARPAHRAGPVAPPLNGGGTASRY